MEKSEKVILWFIGIILFVILTILFIVKASVPAFKLGTAFITMGVVIAIFVAVGIVVHFIFSKGKPDELKDEKLPSAITLLEARERAKIATQNIDYAEYTILIEDGTEQLGKNLKSTIYWYKGIGYYTNKIYYIIINCHFPDKMTTILVEPSEDKINRAKIYAAMNPQEEPVIKRTFNENPLLGTKQVVEEPIIENKKEEEKKKDI